MNFNILSFVKEQLSGYVIGKMSDFLGENPYKTASALENVLPVVLGGLVNKSSNTIGAGLMMDQIKDAGHDGKVFDKLNDIVKDPDAMLDWLSSGSALSNHIFEDKLSGVIDGISGENDIRKTSAASLLSFLSPLVLGAVGKHVTGNSLGISGITDLMANNRIIAEQALTPDMKYILGMDSSQKPIEKTTVNTEPAKNNTEKITTEVTKKKAKKSNTLKWLLPLFLVGLLGSAAYYFLKKKQDATTSFFDKWTKKDKETTVVSTADGDSLKLKLEQRRNNAELKDKAKQLSKSDSDKTSGSLLAKPEVSIPKTTKVETPVEKSVSSTKNTRISSNSSSSSKVSTNSRNRRSNKYSGSDIIEEIDGSSSYSTSSNSGSYSGNSGSANSLSDAIRNRSIGSEFAINGISFVDGGYEFTGSSKSELNRLASLLKAHPRAKIFIQGFAMNGGSDDQDLSQMRAEWVRYALIDRGVKSSRIEARGHCQPSQTTLGSIPKNQVSMKLVGI